VRSLKKAHPDRQLGQLSLQQVIDHYADALKALDEKPILIGHSLGGLLTQLLLGRELALAGVAINSVPPQGVLPKQLSFFRAGFPVINPLFPDSAPYYMSFGEFQYAFVNGLPLAEQQAAYDAHAVPESRLVVRQGRSDLAKVDFKKKRPPLLFIAGEKDHFMPSPLNRDNYKAYRRSRSVTEFKEFPGRTHFIIGQMGWEEVADYALAWLQRRQLVGAAPN
jgi:pimeloyl-ACP methyl ester carboxylesterase